MAGIKTASVRWVEGMTFETFTESGHKGMIDSVPKVGQSKVEGTRAETHPMIYAKLDVVYVVRGKNIPASAVEQAIKLSEEKYCSVGIMIGKTAQIKSRYEIIAE
jgi:uncharacterized OsmC-like protein